MKTVNRTRAMNVFGMITICLLYANSALSGTVTYPTNSYASGDILTATDLNNKFNQIKNAVNDNNAKTTSGIVTIPATAFVSTNPTTCPITYNTTDGVSISATTTNCYVMAPLQLPNAVNVDSMTCYLYDNSTTGSISARYRLRPYTGATSSGGDIFVTTTQSTAIQSGSVFLTTYFIDNSSNVYFIRMQLSDSANVSSTLQIRGCSVSFTY